jgi:hypothetical protein
MNAQPENDAPTHRAGRFRRRRKASREAWLSVSSVTCAWSGLRTKQFVWFLMTQQQQLPPRFASTGIGNGDQHMSKRKSASRFIYAAHQSTTTDDKAVFLAPCSRFPS